jgi:methylglyoxal reductase
VTAIGECGNGLLQFIAIVAASTMKQLPLGKADINASVIGLGCWVLGGGQVWGDDTDDAESIRTVQAALDQGVTLLDTAPAYGWGRSERVVAQAIKGRRDQAVVATKCGIWWDDQRGSFFTEFDGKRVYRSLRPDTIAIEVENSLKRLDIDCIDLYQTHWPAIAPEETPIRDTMAALVKLKEQGKIRAIGVSNVSPDELEENLRHGPVVSDQFRYSMLYRQPEADILPRCQQHGLATLTYMSLEQGLLTGKVGLDREFKAGDFRTNAQWNPWYTPANRPRVLELLEGWKPLCRKYDCTLAQLVMAWTLAQDGVTHVLAGARRPDQIRETAAAADLTVEPEDLAKLRADVIALGDPTSAAQS